MHKPSLWKPALIGGAVFGLLGATPLISAVNCCCCALVVAGGFVAAYLHSNACKKSGAAFGAADGALVGLAAGGFYALVSSFVQGLLTLVMKPDYDQILEKIDSGGAPPEALEFAERIVELLSGPLGLVIMFVGTLIIGLVFATLGGLIGGAVFKFEPVAPPPPSPPTPGVE
jgi:hypothetical protein